MYGAKRSMGGGSTDYEIMEVESVKLISINYAAIFHIHIRLAFPVCRGY